MTHHDAVRRRPTHHCPSAVHRLGPPLFLRWDDRRIVDLLRFSFTSTYEPYVTNLSNCSPTQRDVMFEYFQLK